MWRNGLVFTIILNLVLAPVAQAKDEARQFVPRPPPHVSVLNTVQANTNINEKLVGHNRLPKTLSALRNSSRTAKAVHAANFVQNEVLQIGSTSIVLAALTFKAASDRNEMNALSKGTYHSDQSFDPNAPVCGQNRDAYVAEDVLCSGDFLLGFVTGSVYALGSGATKLVLYFLKSQKTRIPFLNVVLGLFSMSLMMTLSQTAAILWSQATKYLDEGEAAAARGLAGRAAIARMSGKWAAFQASTDGALLAKMVGIMRDIVIVNETFRAQWIYNVWRFGLARGEFISSVAVLMAASSAGQAAGVGLAAALGWTVPMAGAILGAVFGIGALYTLFSSSAPQSLTQILQTVRQSYAGQRLDDNEGFMNFLADRFQLSKYPYVAESDHVKYVWKYMNETLKSRVSYRDDWVNVGVEKFFELKLETESMSQKIKIAEKIINNADIAKNLYFDANGKILSLNEVMNKTCVYPKVDPNQPIGLGAFYVPPEPCKEPEVALQLRTLDSLKKLVGEARQELPRLAEALVEIYAHDQKMAEELNARDDVLLPFPIARQVDEFKNRSSTLKQNFQNLFSVLDDNLARQWNIEWTSVPEEHRKLEIAVRGIFDSYYSFGFTENVVYDSLMQRVQN